MTELETRMLATLKSIVETWDVASATDRMFGPIASARSIIAEVPGHDDFASAVASCGTPDPSPAGCIVTGLATGGKPPL